METHIFVLDFLPAGRPTDPIGRREPVAIGIGATELKLLEAVVRPGASIPPGSRVALHPEGGVASPVDHVRRRLAYAELTAAAKTELSEALRKLVLADSPRFVRFFNEAPAVSRRFHLLELLPGIGKRTMQAIVDERRRAPFAGFPDLETRLHLKSPEGLIADRIERELSGGDEKYRLFVTP